MLFLVVGFGVSVCFAGLGVVLENPNLLKQTLRIVGN